MTRIAAAVRDYFGRQVQPRTLAEPQTDQAATQHLHRTWGDHPVHGLTPQRMAALMEGAEGGDLARQSDLFADMRDTDPHLDAEMGKRERAILTLPWSVEPPRNPSAREKRQAKALGEIVAAVPDLEDVLLQMMDAAGHGFACLEITWARPGAGERLPERIEHRPQSWFQTDQLTRSEIRLRDQTPGGAELWPMGWITHRHAARSGYLWRSGLYRTLSWPWIMRQFALRDMAEWLEIYGLPMRLGYYRPGAEKSEKATLYRAVRDLGRHAAGIMPEGMRVELLEAARGDPDPFARMIEHAEAVISRAILGGSLSSTPAATGLGSGVADLQGEVKRDLLLSDARQIAGTLNRDLLWPIAALNGLATTPDRCPVWQFDTREPADLTAFSQSLERLAAAGMGPHIPVRWVQEQAGIPAPVEGEETLGSAAPPTTPPLDGAALSRPAWPRLAATSTPDGAADAIDPQVARLGAAAEPLIEAQLAVIRAEIDRTLADGGDLAALQGRLATLYPELPQGQLVDVLGEAFAALALAGVDDVEAGR